MINYFKHVKIYLSDFWIRNFWRHPNRLMGLKVTLSVAILLIPSILAGNAGLGGTLALGVLGGAIAETDDHPRGRVKSLALTILGFLISSISVELLHPYPLPFAVGLFFSSFLFIIIGGINERYRGITFGTLLVAIYTMLGVGMGNPWYYQPGALASGALFYGLISLLLLMKKPWRPLQEELSIGFKHLGKYISIKSKLFPSDETTQDYTRNQLAQKNIELVQAIKRTHRVLRSYASEIGKKDENLGKYYRRWLILQQLHERAASSHESYDLLSAKTDNIKLVEGLGQLLFEISQAVDQYSECLLTNKEYKHPLSLQWTLAALSDMMEHHKDDNQYAALSLLFKNLTEMERIMRKIAEPSTTDDVPSDYEPLTIKQRLKILFDRQHPRFKYALRLSISLLVGYGLMYFLHLEKGEWILLTSILVSQQSFISTRQRFFERVLGTLYGVVLGLLLIQLLPTLAGNIILLLISYYLFFYYTKQKYAIAVIFVTIIVVTLFNIQFNQGIEVMGARMLHTIIGSVLAYLSVRFILPDWQYRNLSQLLSNALQSNESYFEAIYSDKVGSEAYNIVRQNAHQADNALTSAWQSIKVEPRRAKQFQDQAFRLTYLNHSMLSYISAFGAHNKGEKLDDGNKAVCQEISDILCTANSLLLQGPEKDKMNPVLLETLDDDREEARNRGMILLSNIRRFAYELYLEAKTMSRRHR